LRIGVFSDDTIDHEFESETIIAWQGRGSDLGADFKYLESQPKIARAGFFADSPGVSSFALENESKTLAFCAARSHIVAVR
jgi:hypothetical protein